MKLHVLPDLEMVVKAAQEAKVTITEVNFVRDSADDALDGLAIHIDGKDHAVGYFSYLLEQNNLKALV